MSASLRLTLLALGLLFGVAIEAQIRTSLAVRARLNIPPAQIENLGYQLRQQERAREALEAQVVELRDRIASYQQAAAEQQKGQDALLSQLREFRMSTGLTLLEGPGVIVALRDSERPLRLGENPNEVILHNYDLVVIVNDLWAAGAEAVAVNGERFVATTPIQSVFRTFMINARRVTPPIRIEAIGEPDRLAAYVSRRGGYLDLLREFSFPVRVSRARRLTIPAYKGTFPLRYATPSR